MITRTRTPRILAGLMSLALVAAACGSDDETVTTDPPAVAETTAEAMDDEAMDDEAMSDEAMDDEAMSDEAMDDEAMSDEAMDDEACLLYTSPSPRDWIWHRVCRLLL